MTTNEAKLNSDWQRQLDRLVDGELNEAEQRELLRSLDAQPDGWRRCALAFLEAQSWQREMRGLGQATAETPAARETSQAPARISFPAAITQSKLSSHADGRGPAPLVPTPSAAWRVPHVGLPLAMAATFLVAFGLAWTMRGPRLAPQIEEAAVTAPVVTALASAERPAANTDGSTPQDPWNTVTLVMDGGPQGQREIKYPVIDNPGDDRWLEVQEPVVPRELRAAIERLGHQVRERRQFVPVDLEDGRRMVVPVDEVQFTPVSARSYQ